MPKYERPSRGDLFAVNYESPYGGMREIRSVVSSAGGGRAELENGGAVDLEAREYGTPSGETAELYGTRVVVPAAQVRHPGVEPGDVVKFGQGSTTHRVEAVEDGMVTTADGWTRPVTHVTAFDEDTGRHDPFSLPGDGGWI